MSSSDGAWHGGDDRGPFRGNRTDERHRGVGMLETILRVGVVPVIETDDQGICGVIQNSHSFIHTFLSAVRLPDDKTRSTHRQVKTAAARVPTQESCVRVHQSTPRLVL